MKRTKEEAEETRDAIVAAALRVCSMRGYRGTSLEEIAAEAGVSRGAIHWHFGTKFKLFVYIGRKAADKIDSFLEMAGRRDCSTMETLRDVMTLFFRSIFDDPTFRDAVHLAMRVRMTNDMNDLVDLYNESVLRRKRYIVSVIQEGVRKGEISDIVDPNLVAGAILSFMSGSLHYWIFNREIFPVERNLDTYVSLLLEGINNIITNGN